MNEPMISVIIPTYKRPLRMLMRCIDSVRIQAYPNLEIIVIDDNPPDSEWRQMVREWATMQQDIRYIEQPQNQGVSAARNRAIALSQGEYIAFLDDDDEWLPGKLAKQMPLFAEGYGVVFSNAESVHVDSDGTIVRREPHYPKEAFVSHPDHKRMLYTCDVGSPSSVVMTREALEMTGDFDTNLRTCEDYDMWIRAIQKHRFCGINEHLMRYYIQLNGQQLTGDKTRFNTARRQIYKKNRKGYLRYPASALRPCYEMSLYALEFHKYGALLGCFALIAGHMVLALFVEPRRLFHIMKDFIKKRIH